MESAFSTLIRRHFAHLFSCERQAYFLNALRAYSCLALGLLMFSCGGPRPASHETSSGESSEFPSNYLVVFIIHGDAGYQFHDTEGNSYRADEEALAAAQRVAEQNSEAEVFIFHEKHRRHFLFLFPRHDGAFYYYRNGLLLAQESYWRDQGLSRFDPEVDLYNRFHLEEQNEPKRIFFYFGHQIPEIGGKGYDASYRSRSFTVNDLVYGLERLTCNSPAFDLVVLSTCFNGTPYTVSALSPYARYIVASPGNLHLSYMDLRPFEALDIGLRDGDVYALAKECARQSFDRLTETIQTEITVSVYDVDRVQEFLYSVDSVYNQALTALKEETATSMEHCDCAEDSVYVRPGMSEGTDVLFRPARFGRSAHKQNHSGWECPKIPK